MAKEDMTRLDNLRKGNRAALAQAITLVESARADHRIEATALLTAALPFTGKAVRLGITGVPGVGKSTTIDAFGEMLIEKGHRVAVLAVDPSSSRTGGAILGDKTRMARLSMNENAFIRPSPSSGTLGGVAAKTREVMLLCEAAGFDVILIETVGVGQSETMVADMVDAFLVLMLPNAGDELQGIKKGILELADIVAVNKADGEGLLRAQVAASTYRAALALVAAKSPNWHVPILCCSGLTGEGLNEIWEQVLLYQTRMTQSGEWITKREAQAINWFHRLVQQGFEARLQEKETREAMQALALQIKKGEISPSFAADSLLKTIMC